MSYEAILYETRGPIAIVTLNRPERLNAIGQAVREEVHAALEAAHQDDRRQAVVAAHLGGEIAVLHDLCLAGCVRERSEIRRTEKMNGRKYGSAL